MFSIRSLALGSVIALGMATTATAQSAADSAARKELRQDRREVRSDKRELRGDKREIKGDHREIAGDRREVRST